MYDHTTNSVCSSASCVLRLLFFYPCPYVLNESSVPNIAEDLSNTNPSFYILRNQKKCRL